MSVIRFSKPGDNLVVMRFLAEGKHAISKPCIYCQKHIMAAGIENVIYMDEDGDFVKTKAKFLCKK
jgi:hypothetical protein